MPILSNTCPYCGAPYTLAFAGCRDKCRMATLSAALVRAACEADIREDDERAWKR